MKTKKDIYFTDEFRRPYNYVNEGPRIAIPKGSDVTTYGKVNKKGLIVVYFTDIRDNVQKGPAKVYLDILTDALTG